ncbi:MAG: hypothetical protein HY220_01355 [Candidatus Sungbacteria bacterium]|uniref:DDH domain-containing protein n=1 Tax=Candidatus Sungiibacteriota bacterium TaxID=2750080 RepID=A0A9D6QRV0_9BACT|nr:hypothetical protein [Candidatus Sungbacteria bacterium]
MIPEESIREAQTLIGTSNQILLALPQATSPDTLAAAEFLLRRFALMGKSVRVSPYVPQSREWDFLPTKSLERLSNPSGDTVIVINTESSAINEIRYEKDEDEVRVIISPKNEPISASSVSILESAKEMDLIITIGAEKLEALGDFYHTNPNLFFETPIIALDHRPSNDHHGNANVIDPEAVSLTEVGFGLIDAIRPHIFFSKDEATLILAGILSKSKNFLDGVISPKTLFLSKACVIEGARRKNILSAMGGASAAPDAALWGRAAIRSRYIFPESIFMACLVKKDFLEAKADAKEIINVMHKIDLHLIEPKTIVLFWQEPGSVNVNAIIEIRNGDLPRFTSGLDGSRQNGFTRLDGMFYTFAEAEREVLSRLGRRNSR